MKENGVKTIAQNNRIMWLNEKHIEGLDHKNLRVTTSKYLSNYRKQRYEIVNKPKKRPNRIFIDKKLAIEIIMDCRTTSAHRLRTT